MLFLKILLTEFIAEMGDKTQLMLVAMTSRYKVKDIVIGTAAAVLVLNGLAVLAGGLVSEFVPDWLIKLVAGAAFLFFALTSLKKDDDEEEAEGKGKFKVAAIAVFCTFFVAELGDKTQLTAITFGANEGMEKAIIVWLACSIGLFAADMVGMAVGLLVKNKMPTGFLNVLAYVIFAIFGVLTLKTGFELLLNGEYLIPITVVIIAVFIILSVIIYLIENKKTKKALEETK
ncbi:MAG: TMEM165/GDT1 family protein [Lachnospiraceae bacterium]|nr:TMEM165/GDT1 family protein [Lachnospiraceae bacterium]